MLVDHSRAAAEAAGSLFFDLLFGEGETGVGEASGLCRIRARNLTGAAVEAVDGDHDVVLVELYEMTAVACKSETLAGMHIAVQRFGGFTACSYRVNGKLRTCQSIAAGEYVGLSSLESNGIGNDGAVLVEGHALGSDAAEIDLLADSADNGIDFDSFKFAGADGLSAALFVGLAELHELDLQAGDLFAVADDLDRRAQEAELNALFTCLCDLSLVGGHLRLAAAVDDIGLVSAEAHSAAADVHCDVAAADDRALFAYFGVLVEIDLAHEINAAVNALQSLAGNTERGGLLCADAEEEALVALSAQLVERDILADLNAASELNAHLAQNVDLGVHNVLFKAEAGDAGGEHAAGDLILLEHGHGVAHVGKIICAAQTGRAAADDGDLLIIALAGLTVSAQRGNIARFGMQLLLGDELLDLVDSDGIVDSAAGACILAAAVADTAADGGEGVILLDELERVKIAALCGHLDVALDCDMRGAGGLAGRRAAVIAVYHVVVAVVLIPLFGTPFGVVGQLVLGIFYGAVLCAQLLAELCSASGADLDAFAAGNALFLVDMRYVCAARHVGGVEQLGCAQGVADAGRAVADSEDLVLAVNICDLVDVAFILCALEYLHYFVIGDGLAVLAGLVAVSCAVADSNAPEIFNIAGTLAALGLRTAAGAYADREVIVFFQPVGKMLHADGLGAVGDRLFNGNNMHAYPGASGRHHRRDLFEWQACHCVEEVAYFGMRVDKALAHVEKFGGARDEQRQQILLHMLRIFPVPLDQADFSHLLELGFKLFDVGPAGRLRDLLDSLRLALRHAQRDVHHVIVQNVDKTPVFRAFLGELFKTKFVWDAVGHLLAEGKKLFLVCYHMFLPSKINLIRCLLSPHYRIPHKRRLVTRQIVIK